MRGRKADSASLWQRILSKVSKQENGCWLWTGTRYGPQASYGNAWWNGKANPAHRVFYQVLKGPIPEGFDVDHLCHNPLCVNPDHLEAKTHKANCRNNKKANRTHCKNGHLWIAENLLNIKDGLHSCRICAYESMKRFKERHPDSNRLACRRYYHNVVKPRSLHIIDSHKIETPVLHPESIA